MGIFKFIGAALGYSYMGFIGAIVGFFVGSMIDRMISGGATISAGGGGGQWGTGGRGGAAGGYRDPFGSQRQATITKDFNVSLVLLTAAVMKADGKVVKSELGYVKNFFSQQFGAEASREYVLMLQDVLKKEIPLQQVGQKISGYMELPMRLQLLHYLFGVAKSDGNVHSEEADLIQQIARYMRIPQVDFESIKAMFYKEVGSAYKILDIDQSATDSEVKKAYRHMANRYHPDKVAQLGREVQKGAKEKFQKIQEAYEQIRTERGMK